MENMEVNLIPFRCSQEEAAMIRKYWPLKFAKNLQIEAYSDLDLTDIILEKLDYGDSHLFTASQIAQLLFIEVPLKKLPSAQLVGRQMQFLGFSSKIARVGKSHPQKVYLCKRKHS